MFDKIKKDVETLRNAETIAYQAGFTAGEEEGKRKIKEQWQDAIDYIGYAFKEGRIDEGQAIDILCDQKKTLEIIDKADAMNEAEIESQLLEGSN